MRLRIQPPSVTCHVLTLIAGLLLAGCGGPELKPAGPKVEGNAPTPYTAEQIREACPPGREDVHRITAGGRTTERWMRFEEGTGEKAIIGGGILDAQGEKTATQTDTQDWDTLRRHAEFPEKATVITSTSTRVPAGEFPALRYTVTQNRPGRLVVRDLWFAPSLPGPPVRMEARENGKLVFEMVLLRTTAPH